MTTVGLFEPSWHQALIPPMATIAHEATNDVTVFTTEENYDHASTALDDAVVDGCGWVIENEDQSHRSFFEQVERATAELDVLWTITPYGNSEIVQAMLGFSPRCPSVTFVHASSRFVPSRYPAVGDVLSPFVESFAHYLPGPIRGRALNRMSPYLVPRILREYDSVVALYPPVAEFVEQEVEPNAVVDWFLPEFNRPDAAVDHDGLQITVPGRVKDSLRDYDLLFDVLDEVSSARDRLTVCILGRPVGDSGERIIRRCERYEERGYDIQYYPGGEWVPEAEFAHQIARTDMIFAPINIRGQTGDRGQDRVRGRTITSGAIGDAVHIGRPLVVPREFPVAPEFEGLLTTYEDSRDALAFVESWVASKETRQELQHRAESVVRRFSLEDQADRFEQLCQRAIEAGGRASEELP